MAIKINVYEGHIASIIIKFLHSSFIAVVLHELQLISPFHLVTFTNLIFKHFITFALSRELCNFSCTALKM